MTLNNFIENMNEWNNQKVHNNAGAATGVLKRAQELGLPSEALRAIEETLTTMSKDTSMQTAFNQLVSRLTNNCESAKQAIDLWQTVDMEDCLKDMIMACSIISAADYAKEYYIEHQLDDRIFLDTFRDITIWMMECKNNCGWWGLKEAKWLVNHIHHRLFRLGRLQFMLITVNFPYLLLKDKNAQRSKWVAKGDMDCTMDGYVVQEHTADLEIAYRTYLKKEEDFIIAHEAVDGVISKEKSRFELNDWSIRLDLENSMVLDIHIPAGEKLSKEACEESLSAAKLFFTSQMPKAFVCQSWLLDRNLYHILKPYSNILKFQELFTIVPPVNMSFTQSLERIFGKGKEIENIHPQNSLQKNALDYIKSGKILRQGLGIISIDEWCGK